MVWGRSGEGGRTSGDRLWTAPVDNGRARHAQRVDARLLGSIGKADARILNQYFDDSVVASYVNRLRSHLHC